jgi:hypothetical protein
MNTNKTFGIILCSRGRDARYRMLQAGEVQTAEDYERTGANPPIRAPWPKTTSMVDNGQTDPPSNHAET